MPGPQVEKKQADQAASPAAAPAKKPSMLKRAWAMTGLDPITIHTNAEGGLFLQLYA